MSIVIYYDLAEVTPREASLARSRAGAGAREVIAGSSQWRQSIPGPQPWIELDCRDPEYNRLLRAWVDETLLRIEGDKVLTTRHGISLSEVARLSLHFAVRNVEHRWFALCNIVRRWSPQRVIWVVDRPERTVRALARTGLACRVEMLGARSSLPASFVAAKRSLSRCLRPHWRRALHALRRPARSLTNSPVATVVFTEYFANSVHVALPVARELEAREGLSVAWLAGRSQVSEVLTRAGASHWELEQILPRDVFHRAGLTQSERRRLSALIDRLPEDAFKGTGLPGGRAYLEPILKAHLLDALDDAARWIETYNYALGRLKPAAVVSTSYSGAPGRAAALVARKLGAKAIYLQHGLLPEQSSYAFSFCNDLMLLWGDHDRRCLSNAGVPAVQIQVVGATIYDGVAERLAHSGERDFPPRGEPLRIAFLPTRTKVVVEGEAALGAVLSAVQAIPGAALTVKPHPGDARLTYFEKMLHDRREVHLARNQPACNLILESDLVIVVESTTGMEACVAQRPLITLTSSGVASYLPYAAYGAAVHVEGQAGRVAAQLQQAIEGLHSPERRAALAAGRKRLLDDMLCGGDPQSTHRAASAIAASLPAAPLERTAPQ